MRIAIGSDHAGFEQKQMLKSYIANELGHVCGTGIGIAIAADKVAGVRASSITTPEFADLFRRHNDGNVIGLSGRFVDPEVNREIVRVFLTSEFEGGRHAQRVAKIMKLDTTGKVKPVARPAVHPAV